MSQQNLMQESMDLYMRIVDEAIVEKRKRGGTYSQQGNITLIAEMIRESPKPAQIIIQTLYQSTKDTRNEGQDTAALHGLWITTAYLMEFGKMDPSSLMLKQMAPDFYDAAVNTIREQGL